MTQLVNFITIFVVEFSRNQLFWKLRQWCVVGAGSHIERQNCYFWLFFHLARHSSCKTWNCFWQNSYFQDFLPCSPLTTYLQGSCCPKHRQVARDEAIQWVLWCPDLVIMGELGWIVLVLVLVEWLCYWDFGRGDVEEIKTSAIYLFLKEERDGGEDKANVARPTSGHQSSFVQSCLNFIIWLFFLQPEIWGNRGEKEETGCTDWNPTPPTQTNPSY